MPEAASLSLDDLPPLKFIASGDDEDARQANLLTVQPSPGYPHAVFLLADAITKRADLVLMDFTPAAVSVRYQVDGIWHTMPALQRQVGDYMVASLKQLAGVDYRERRQRQVGRFTADYLKYAHKCRLTSQGIPAGERVVVEIQRQRPPLETLEEIGMRPGMRTQLVAAMNEPGGLVLFGSLPGDGLSTTWRAALQATDRYMRDFFTLQEQSRQEPEIVNIGNETWDESAGQTMSTALTSLLLREPNAIAFAEISDGPALDKMCDLANNRQVTVITRLNARYAVEAVVRALMLKPDVAEFAAALRTVVCQRVVRRLCTRCRQPFQPNPALLTQLGLPPERVPVLYRRFEPSPEQLTDEKGNPVELPPCEKCGGPGFYERTAIFELLQVDDRFRQAMRETPTVQSLTAAANASGHISLRDEGIVLVARGDISLEELQRVLKK